MNTRLVHPVSALAGATVLLGACLLSGMQQPGLGDENREILRHMSIVFLPDGLGGTAKTIRFTGVNVQVANGLKSTNGFPFDPDSMDPLDTVVNSVGNLVVGYNELGNSIGFGDDRTGSHNIIVGHGNNYTSFGGFVGPRDNMISAPFASVFAGWRNRAGGIASSVSGGHDNSASGDFSSVSGGGLNRASGSSSSVSGGGNNTASGSYSSVSGGGWWTPAYGGNLAGGDFSSVSGGFGNVASGSSSSVSGGSSSIAGFPYSSVSGGRNNLAFGYYSSVSGGANRSVSGTDNWLGGKYFSNN